MGGIDYVIVLRGNCVWNTQSTCWAKQQPCSSKLLNIAGCRELRILSEHGMLALLETNQAKTVGVTKPDDCGRIARVFHEVERFRSIDRNLRNSLDFRGIADIQDREVLTLVGFDIEKRLTVIGVMEVHGLAGSLR